MESTGVYWLQVYRRLEGFFELVVTNAHQIKAVPGRKTDVQDADWIADLLQHGLLRASFVPSQEQQELRDLTRLRVSLVQERARMVNRVHKVLEEAGIKLSCVLSDVMGLSGRAILACAVCRGKRPGASGEPHASKCACHAGASGGSSYREICESIIALCYENCSALIEAQGLSITHVEQEIARRVSPFEEQIQRCEQHQRE